jgi:hypothetical protein
MQNNMWAVILGAFLLASVLFIGMFGDNAIRERELERFEQPVCKVWGET